MGPELVQLGYTVLSHRFNTLREHIANKLVLCFRLEEEGCAEGSKVGPEEEVEGVEAKGTPSCMLGVVMMAVQTLISELHPLVIKLVARTHPVVVLGG